MISHCGLRGNSYFCDIFILIFSIMKRLICLFIVCFFGVLAFCQENQMTALGQDNPSASYRLFPTTGTWTFLKLNTEDGRIWQVQYHSFTNEPPFETYLNQIPLATGSDKKPGRCTLYPTENDWTFILLDTISGSTWKVQWSQKAENRSIIPISN